MKSSLYKSQQKLIRYKNAVFISKSRGDLFRCTAEGAATKFVIPAKAGIGMIMGERSEHKIKRIEMKTFVNLLSIFRIIAAFLIVPLLLEQLFMDAFIVFVLAAASDFLDGFLARRFNAVTKLGGVLDQIGDKFLTVIALVMIVMFLQIWQIIVPAILMICRDLYVSGLREFLGTQKIEMPVAKDKFALAKIKTAMQLLAISGIFLWIWGVNADWAADDAMHRLFIYSVAGMWIAAALSVATAVQYTMTVVRHMSAPVAPKPNGIGGKKK